MAGPVRSERDHVLVGLLALGVSQAAAAREAGCSERTVRRRLADPAFVTAVDAERLRIAEQVLDALMIGARAAVRRLHRLVDDDEQPARVQVAAARALLSSAVSWRDQVELDQRLSAVEAAVAARNTLRAVQ